MAWKTDHLPDGQDNRAGDGTPDALLRFVPAALLVQIAASQAGIGPFAARNRETPARAAQHYGQAGLRRPARRPALVA